MTESGKSQAWVAQEEIRAIEQSLPEVGSLVAEIENNRPLSSWSKEEILRLMFRTVRAYQENMQKITAVEGPPF